MKNLEELYEDVISESNGISEAKELLKRLKDTAKSIDQLRTKMYNNMFKDGTADKILSEFNTASQQIQIYLRDEVKTLSYILKKYKG